MNWYIPISAALAIVAPTDSYKNVAPSLGIAGSPTATGAGIGGGVSWLDANQDGQPDLVITAPTSLPRLILKKSGGFTVDEDSLIPNTAPAYANGHVILDIEGDGDDDILLLRNYSNALLRNDGGTFTDVSQTHLPQNQSWSVSGAAGDFDGDGDTDLWIGGYISIVSYPDHLCTPDQLLENDGNGRFRNRSEDLGLNRQGCTLASAMSDYDGDGDLDLMSINDFGQFVETNGLYRNDGPEGNTWKFTDVTQTLGWDTPLYGMGLAVADVNHDSVLDYFVTSIGRPLMLTGQPGGSFKDVTDKYGAGIALASGGWQVTWSAVLDDLNGDGWIDLFAAGGNIPATSYLENQSVMPNMLLAGGPDLPWTDGPSSWSIPEIQKNNARGIAPLDYNNDGLIDLAVAHASGILSLYQNTSSTPPKLRIRLRPTVTGPDASGTRITATCGPFQRMREITGGGAFGGTVSPITQFTFPSPCDDVGTPVNIVIKWPGGYIQSELAVTGKLYDIKEPKWLKVTQSVIEVSLNGATGLPLPSNTAVEITAEGINVSPAVNQGKGKWSANVVEPVGAQESKVTITVNGKPLAAHPKLQWVSKTDVELYTVPQHIISGQEFTIVAIPKDANGSPIGDTNTVSVNLGSQTLDMNTNGDGLYFAKAAPTDANSVNAQLFISGKVYGATATFPVHANVDFARSRVRLSRLIQPSFEGPELVPFNVQAYLRDKNGAELIGDASQLALTVNGEELMPVDAVEMNGEMLVAYDPKLVPDQAIVDVSYAGTPLGASQISKHIASVDDIAQQIDINRSRCGISMATLRADGQDTAIAVFFLRDAYGNPVPHFGAEIQPVLNGVSYVMGSLKHTDETLRFGIRAGLETGTAQVAIKIAGNSVGVNCNVQLLPALPLPQVLNNQLSQITAKPPNAPAENKAPVGVKFYPRLMSGRLAGSGLNVAIESTLGKFINDTHYAGNGRYERTLMSQAPGDAKITATVEEPPLSVATWVLFFLDGPVPSDAEPSEAENPLTADEPNDELGAIVEDDIDTSSSDDTAADTTTADASNSSDITTLPQADAEQNGQNTNLDTGAQVPKKTDFNATKQEAVSHDGGCSTGSRSSHWQVIGFMLFVALLIQRMKCDDPGRG